MADPRLAVATALRDRLRRDLGPDGRIGLVRDYVRGEYQMYMPPGATPEFRKMAQQSRTPWLPLIVDTFAKSLFVDGYRSTDGKDRPAWAYWQANSLDARQSIAHRTALTYGDASVLVLPGDPTPVIRPLRVTEVVTGWSDPDAPFPDYALVRAGVEWHLYGPQTRLRLGLDDPASDQWIELGEEAHGMPTCPVVRFRPQLDDESLGIVRPLLPVQQRIDAIVFATQIALHYGAFRQRWATGLLIPVDPETGERVKPFQASIDRVWTSENQDTKFGDFAQTDVSGHLQAYLSSVRTLAALSQTPPTVLLGELVNLSAEALAATYDATTRRIEEFQTIFGESWEQVLRVAAAADGDADGAADDAAQVRWRDTEARALAATVDALGKLSQMLSVPREMLWEMIPGWTQTDVERAREILAEQQAGEAVNQARAFGLTGLTDDGQPA